MAPGQVPQSVRHARVGRDNSLFNRDGLPERPLCRREVAGRFLGVPEVNVINGQTALWLFPNGLAASVSLARFNSLPNITAGRGSVSQNKVLTTDLTQRLRQSFLIRKGRGVRRGQTAVDVERPAKCIQGFCVLSE